jgi:hypothetical protein
MFFSQGERYFQRRLVAGDNDAHVIDGLALMRACLKKALQSYYREIGGIYNTFNSIPTLVKQLVDYIANDAKNGPSEGNFIGLLYELYKGSPGSQDRVPFVWGADGLTQFTERSGAEKYKLYRDQFLCESLIEMIISGLRDLPDEPIQKEEIKIWKDILDCLRRGSEKDRRFWTTKDNTKLTIGTEGIRDSGSPKTKRKIEAANTFVSTDKRVTVGLRQPKPKL